MMHPPATARPAPATQPYGWAGRHLLCFDTETTGPDPATARLVTFALVQISPEGERVTSRAGIVDPGVEIPAEATAVHGISTERARAEGARPAAALRTVAAAFYGAMMDRTPVCAYNAAYDLTVLDHEVMRHTSELGAAEAREIREIIHEIKVIDPYVLDKGADKRRKGSRRLADVAAHYGVEITDWHDADADALAAGLIAQAFAAKYPAVGRMSLEAIHAKQVELAAAQAQSLRAYFRRTMQGAKAATVLDAWPVRTARP